jgi:uncharacterized paraquat-inducible protein A
MVHLIAQPADLEGVQLFVYLLLALLLLVGVPGVILFSIFRMLRRYGSPRRRLSGRCERCGYDLRASKERCPECGTAIPANRE